MKKQRKKERKKERNEERSHQAFKVIIYFSDITNEVIKNKKNVFRICQCRLRLTVDKI